MKKGQIIRRKLNDGTPEGPYLRIDEFKCNAQVIVAHMINGKSTSLLARARVYEPKVLKFVLSDCIINRIQEGIQKAIIHDMSSTWNYQKMSGAEIVSCRSATNSTKNVVLRIDGISIVSWNRKDQIRLQLGEIIEHIGFSKRQQYIYRQ